MAAKEGNKNAKGNSGGKVWSQENRDRAVELKRLCLEEAIKIMQGKSKTAKMQVMLKVLSNAIPQEHKHSGDENDRTPIPFMRVEDLKK